MAVSASSLGMLLRRHDQSDAMRKCPDCGKAVRDRAAGRLGYCDRCQDFTGMCGAGRKIICPDVMTSTSWHMPCTSLGGTAWDITLADDPRRTLLCGEHDSQLRAGRVPWVKLAVPVARR